MAEQEAHRRIQAERAAASAMESAALKRRKAQELMQKADLAMYKAVMALRYADAAQAGKSVDFLDSELNGDDKEWRMQWWCSPVLHRAMLLGFAGSICGQTHWEGMPLVAELWTVTEEFVIFV